MIFSDEMFSVGNVGLFEQAILVLADEEIRDVLLEREFGSFFARHVQSA